MKKIIFLFIITILFSCNSKLNKEEKIFFDNLISNIEHDYDNWDTTQDKYGNGTFTDGKTKIILENLSEDSRYYVTLVMYYNGVKLEKREDEDRRIKKIKELSKIKLSQRLNIIKHEKLK